MKQLLKNFYVIILAIVSLTITSSALSNEDINEQKSKEPLMLIRFNQPNIYFEEPLQKIINKALEIKPSAKFILYYNIKVTGNTAIDNKSRKVAFDNTKTIVNSLIKNGVYKENIVINYLDDQHLDHDEIRIFVE